MPRFFAHVLCRGVEILLGLGLIQAVISLERLV